MRGKEVPADKEDLVAFQGSKVSSTIFIYQSIYLFGLDLNFMRFLCWVTSFVDFGFVCGGVCFDLYFLSNVAISNFFLIFGQKQAI